MSGRPIAILCAAAALAMTAAPQARAESVADFYRGRQIEYNLATSTGGSWDVYLRVLSNHLGKYIPGHPKIVIQYMPGAGGVKALNYMYNAAPRDGSYIGTPLSTALLYAVLNPGKVKFDAPKFHWIGSMARIQDVISVWSAGPIKTIEDARKQEVKVGATGRSSNSFLDIAMANNLLGTKFKPVLGYKGGAEINLAIERGEVQGRANTWDGWATAMPQWLTDKKIINLVQLGPSKLAEIGEVPLFGDLVKDPKDKPVVDFLSVGLTVGRSVYMPPGTPPERVAALRQAFEKAMKDPAYIKDAEAHKMSTGDWKSGAEIQTVIERTFSSPPEIVKRAKAALTLN
jgi:tripartite-type tricarboxylate transporter receptor subunit TctC